MGTGGGLFNANDTIGAARLNTKSCTIDTGANLTALGTTYAGQLAYATTTDGVFTIDGLYERNTANNAWVLVRQFDGNTLTESAEQNTTPVADNADFTMVVNIKYYAFFTLPTTEKFYHFTGMEWKNGASISGTITSGIDVVNANPPTINSTQMLGLGIKTTPSGINSIQRTSIVSSNPVRGGTICGAWIRGDTSPVVREQTGLGSQNQTKSDVEDGLFDDSAFSSTTARKYIKVYFVGYS